MKIVEIFQTVQGEGPKLGTPSLFVRFGGCNLRCQFKGEACDTPYAVFTPQQLDKKNPALKHGYERWVTYVLEDLIADIYCEGIDHIVLTGGEPLLYQAQIIELAKELNGFTFEIETNGTIPILPKLAVFDNFSFNVSVKLKSSNQEALYENKRINKEALISFPEGYSIYKFVITDPVEDLKEIKEIIKIRALPVYIMPEGLSRVQVLKNSPQIIEMAIKNNFKFTPREHINVWDQKKGV